MDERRLEEYKFLRAELESVGDHTYTTLNVILAAIGFIASAGFAEKGDPLVLFPMAAALTFGGYSLMRIEVINVWTVVGYMRWALERGPDSFRWETSLKMRHDRLRKSRNADGSRVKIHRDTFNGHVRILDTINGLLTAAILYAAYFGKSPLLYRLSGLHHRWMMAVTFSCCFPLGLLVWSLTTQGNYGRGGKIETECYKSWTALGEPDAVFGPALKSAVDAKLSENAKHREAPKA